MNINNLQAFLAVAAYGKFSEAAKMLHISQPAISLQVQALEEHYGCRLLDRNGKNVTVTPAGMILKNYAEKILEMCSCIEKEIDEALHQVKGDLKIGASMTIAGHYLPHFLKVFFAKYPQVKISMLVNNTEKILDGVQQNDFDLGLVEGEIMDHGFKTDVFAEDEMVVVVPKDHPLAFNKKREIEVEEFLQYPLVLREKGSGTRDVLEKALQSTGTSIDSLIITMELGSTEAVKGAVEQGIGICVLSRWTVKKEVKEGIFKELFLKKLPVNRTFKLIYNHKRFQTVVSKVFTDELLTYGNYPLKDTLGIL